ncbi:MAG TPA: hypothetical protein PKL13_00780 [bacterium]|nr:hypothetical protein [bacterium]
MSFIGAFPYKESTWFPPEGSDFNFLRDLIYGKITEMKRVPLKEILQGVSQRIYALHLRELEWYIQNSKCLVFGVNNDSCVDLVEKYREDSKFFQIFKRFFSVIDNDYPSSDQYKKDKKFIDFLLKYKFFVVEKSIKDLEVLKKDLSDMILFPLSVFAIEEISSFDLLDCDVVNREMLRAVLICCFPVSQEYNGRGTSREFVFAVEQIIMLGYSLGLWGAIYKDHKLHITLQFSNVQK